MYVIASSRFVFSLITNVININLEMNESYGLAEKLVPQTYIEQGKNAHRTQQNFIKLLLEKVHCLWCAAQFKYF